MKRIPRKAIKNKCFLPAVFLGIVFFLGITYYLQNQLIENYNNQSSVVIQDRKGEIILIEPNGKEYWAQYSNEVPQRFKELLIKKEDKLFSYHLGFNPWSTFKAITGYLGLGPKRASSTITQQLVKILLGNESERTPRNKIIEALYTLSLEIHQSKNEILKMYTNSVYLGNRAQGLTEASHLYFDLSPELLTDGQILQLLSSISSPTLNNPAKSQNEEMALSLAERLNLIKEDITTLNSLEVRENMKNYSHFGNSSFELKTLSNNLEESCQTTLDEELTKKIREIVKRNIEELEVRNAGNGAVIVIKLPENEILTLVGSPDPKSTKEGYQINMLLEPRPIGSTIKPFIYLKAFEKELRPYTLVDDREYKYITAIGFPLYPKNFDYKYRGEISLHYALSNSLNVPAVKVLEYVGLDDFYSFLEDDLEFQPIQSLDNYQLGISLGSLEMSLMDLGKYFTIFPNKGILKNLKLYKEKTLSEKEISGEEYIQLINKILNDRRVGIEQFGLKSELNLFQENYALKTGTSRDFRDSWVIGYTPDFLVGVWVGNSDNSPMDEVSGQVGAGRIWSETMELLLNSEYNLKTPFNFDKLAEYYEKDTIEYGLPGDNYEEHLNILKKEDSVLILNPHQGDNFLLEKNTRIILKAKESVNWLVNNKFLGQGEEIFFIPKDTGSYQIKAVLPEGSQETIIILIN